jgi:hypothetical protein
MGTNVVEFRVHCPRIRHLIFEKTAEAGRSLSLSPPFSLKQALKSSFIGTSPIPRKKGATISLKKDREDSKQ